MKKLYIKIDGEFTEFEDTPQIRQGLHIDKQIAEQAGKEFQIFEPEQLSDEDALSLGLVTKEEIFNKKVTNKLQEISNDFNTELREGHFFSNVLQIEVDCRRTGEKNDKQNVEGLINYMKRNSISSITYKGLNSSKENITKEMLLILIEEMEDYILGLYDKKWLLEEKIKNSNEENLENIKW